jgi:hypothetical protein
MAVIHHNRNKCGKKIKIISYVGSFFFFLLLFYCSNPHASNDILYEVIWGDLSVTFEQAIIYNLDSEYYILLNQTIKSLRIYAWCNVKDALKC